MDIFRNVKIDKWDKTFIQGMFFQYNTNNRFVFHIYARSQNNSSNFKVL